MKIQTKFAAVMCLALGMLLSAASDARAVVLLLDNFNSANDSDLNAGIARQSGTLAPITWTKFAEADITSNQLRVGTAMGQSDVDLNHNFIDAAITAAGGFVVSFDATMNTLNPRLGLFIGSGSGDFSMYFGRGGPDYYYITVEGVQTVQNEPSPVSLALGLPHHYEVTVLTTTFALNGAASVSVEVDGTPLDLDEFQVGNQFTMPFTWASANTNNFRLQNGGTGDMFYDNFQVSTFEAETVPEPSTFVLGALGLAGLGLVAWRRRKGNC